MVQRASKTKRGDRQIWREREKEIGGRGRDKPALRAGYFAYMCATHDNCTLSF